MLPLVLTGRAGLILLERSALDAACAYLRPPENKVEAGGILLGSYRGDHLDITGITVPLRGDRRSPVLFDRRDPGHSRAAAAAWKASGRTITYVGEWHSHISGDGRASSIDIAMWRAVLADNPTATHLLMIVAPDAVRFMEGCGDRLEELTTPVLAR